MLHFLDFLMKVSVICLIMNCVSAVLNYETLQKIFRNFIWRPKFFLALVNAFTKFYLKCNQESRKILNYFWEFVCKKGFWLKYLIKKDSFVFIFLLKVTSRDCFVGRGLKLTNHWNSQLDILIKSLFKSNEDTLMFLTTEKSNVSPSVNNFEWNTRLKSWMENKRNKAPGIKP